MLPRRGSDDVDLRVASLAITCGVTWFDLVLFLLFVPPFLLYDWREMAVSPSPWCPFSSVCWVFLTLSCRQHDAWHVEGVYLLRTFVL